MVTHVLPAPWDRGGARTADVRSEGTGLWAPKRITGPASGGLRPRGRVVTAPPLAPGPARPRPRPLTRLPCAALQVLTELKSDNQRLKDENGALIRVISKLSK